MGEVVTSQGVLPVGEAVTSQGVLQGRIREERGKEKRRRCQREEGENRMCHEPCMVVVPLHSSDQNI